MTTPNGRVSPQLAAALAQVRTEFTKLQRRVAMLEASTRSAQLPNSSIDNDALVVNDASGSPVLQFGLHPDGTFAVSSPGANITPLTPDDPTVVPGILSLVVTWDGGTASGLPALADFAGIQVHCSTETSYVPSPDTFQGMLNPSPLGGGLLVGGLADGITYYVCLVAVNAAGLASPPSDFIAGTPAGVTDSIEAGTITADMLAADMVLAGVVNGTTITGATITGASINITQDGPLLLYQGEPGPGNLIASWSTTGGTDSFANPYPVGLNVGVAGPTQITLLPAVGSAFNITTLIAGVLEAAAALYTNDTNEQIPGLLGALMLGTAAAAKMATALTSPVGSGQGAAIMLEAQNDGGTDTAVITLGIVTTPDGSTEVFSPIMTLTPFALLLYGGASGQVTRSATSGSGTWPIPLGVTTGKAEAIAPGGGALNYAGGSTPGGRGAAGGGEYACEPAMVLTPGGTVAYSVGAAGVGGTTGSAGGTVTITGPSATVTAHGGQGSGAAEAPGLGGTGSGNTIHNPGGTGGQGGTGTVLTGTTSHTESWYASHTYCYSGGAGDSSPAPSDPRDTLINEDGALYQGDDHTGTEGNIAAVILWPYAAIRSAISGYTSITSVAVTVYVSDCYYSAGLYIAYGYLTYTGTFGTSRELDSWGATEAENYYGRFPVGFATMNLDSSIYTAHATTVTASLFYVNPSGTNYSGYFAGGGTWSNSAQIAFGWTTGGAPVTSGGGGGGGGAGGPTGPGANGNPGTASAGGTGGAGGGSPAGTGGKGGANDASGSNGSGTGAGGGGGGYGSASGGNGGGGLAKLTYSGAPPAFLATLAIAAGTDQFGSAYGTGCRLYDAAGNAWRAERAVSYLTANAAQCASSSQTTTGLVLGVASGITYWLDADVIVHADAANSGYLSVGGVACSAFDIWIKWEQLYSATVGAGEHVTRNQTTVGSNNGMNSNAMTSGNIYWVHMQGFFTTSAAGNMSISQASSAAAASFTVQAGSAMRLYPVS